MLNYTKKYCQKLKKFSIIQKGQAMVNEKQKEGQKNEKILNLKNDVIFQAFFSL